MPGQRSLFCMEPGPALLSTGHENPKRQISHHRPLASGHPCPQHRQDWLCSNNLPTVRRCIGCIWRPRSQLYPEQLVAAPLPDTGLPTPPMSKCGNPVSAGAKPPTHGTSGGGSPHSELGRHESNGYRPHYPPPQDSGPRLLGPTQHPASGGGRKTATRPAAGQCGRLPFRATGHAHMVWPFRSRHIQSLSEPVAKQDRR